VPANLTTSRPSSAPRRIQAGGWMTVHPRYTALLHDGGLMQPADVIALPGEVVSGHPDRHVVEVRLPGTDDVYYLKRQHRVGWRERLRQAAAGFGWTSRSEREARVLSHLAARGFPCPEWVAYGENGRGRAFLLVRGLTGPVELRRLLGAGRLSPADRRRVAERLGQAVAELHAARVTTPDLTAKHVFVDPVSFAVTLIDWQSACADQPVGDRDRVEALAALHASLVEGGATARERVRLLWAYRRVTRKSGQPVPRFGEFVRRIAARAAVISTRRSIRDQRQPGVTHAGQRLVWLAGEAVCAVPDVAAVWPRPAVAAPFYSAAPANGRMPEQVCLPDDRPAHLTRFHTFAPLGRLVARLRGRPWRSPGATAGRVLFHLERYGIPAPRLLAFGQRLTGPCTAESFVLYDPLTGVPLGEWLARPVISPEERSEVVEQAGSLRRQLDAAGLRPVTGGEPFRVEPTGRVVVCPLAVRLTSRRARS
jgi:tRNA A-37 threonylcarbamoyl transferase component Bud32